MAVFPVYLICGGNCNSIISGLNFMLSRRNKNILIFLDDCISYILLKFQGGNCNSVISGLTKCMLPRWYLTMPNVIQYKESKKVSLNSAVVLHDRKIRTSLHLLNSFFYCYFFSFVCFCFAFCMFYYFQLIINVL